MIESLGIDENALERWLDNHVPGFHGLRGVEKFATGQSNPTYRLDAASGACVLRAKPPGPLLPSAHLVEREYRVMHALAGTPVPVPAVLALASDATSPIGRAFFVMEHLDGRIFWDPALPDLPTSGRAAVFDAMNATLAALHMVNVDKAGLGDFARPGNYFARQTQTWARQYRASAQPPDPRVEALIGWLGDNMPADDGQVALVHGDYRLDNMIFARDAPRVIGLIDWELATLGHPLADLAYQCMQWRLPHGGGMRGLGGLDRAALGLPDEAGYVAAYCARRAIAVPDNWSFYLAFAYFRLTAILSGVVARARAGNASNPAAAQRYESALPVLVAQATDVIGDPHA